MKVIRLDDGLVVERDGRWFRHDGVRLDDLFEDRVPPGWPRGGVETDPPDAPRAPIESQEVWAAGVTYVRSREARMEESEREADVYDRVYDAERPELFFKATPHRVVGDRAPVVIRSDSSWNVPEAELALAVSRSGRRLGYTIGNDMSSRSIEGENPLYLPQAKIYDGSCALGPCLYLCDEELPPDTTIALAVSRGGSEVFSETTSLSELKRAPDELVSYLRRHNSFPHGCYLLTGTGIVPPAAFTLASGDVISITIEPIGTLTNPVR